MNRFPLHQPYHRVQTSNASSLLYITVSTSTRPVQNNLLFSVPGFLCPIVIFNERGGRAVNSDSMPYSHRYETTAFVDDYSIEFKQP